MRLDERTAVVTGGGRGIGAAIARILAAAGAAVVVSARTRGEIEGVAAMLAERGHRAHAIACDVTDEESVERLAREAAERVGDIDILVNNAGVAFSAPLHKTAKDDWNRVMAVNATGTFLCARAFVPGMVARKWGRVINIASTAGRTGGKYMTAYAASKHAVIGLTRCVAAEVAAHGVTVNAICPGYVDSEMTRESLERIVRETGRPMDQALDAILRTTPQRRLIEPEEVAHLALGLCDDAARGVTGQAIVLDGGGLLA